MRAQQHGRAFTPALTVCECTPPVSWPHVQIQQANNAHASEHGACTHNASSVHTRMGRANVNPCMHASMGQMSIPACTPACMEAWD
eukprot:361096-Chlamydomonas_euryale.AAC.3